MKIFISAAPAQASAVEHCPGKKQPIQGSLAKAALQQQQQIAKSIKRYKHTSKEATEALGQL